MMKTENVPAYLAGADSDPLMVVMAIIIIVLVVVAGALYFKLHAVPEHIAQGKNHTQIQLIAILTILALFTHNNVFWVGALIIAVVELPDFMTPIKSIAKSLAILADRKETEDTNKVTKVKKEESVTVTNTDNIGEND